MEQKNWHHLSWEEVVDFLKADPEKGLSHEEASLRQEKFGKNLLPREKPLSSLKILFNQIKSPLIYILIIAGGVILFFKEWADAIVIFSAVFLNASVGFFQEKKASQALAALKKVVKMEAEVLREGAERRLDASELVPGDTIFLTAGNKVPADARIIESHNLKIREAALTGEWLASLKATETLKKDIPLADKDNMAYTGCTVEDGKGKAVVTATGLDTEMGKVASMVRETEEEKTPLQKKLAHFSKIIGIAVAFVAFFIFAGGVAKGQDVLLMFETAVAVAVAAVPEGIPVAMTVILALGMQRILKRKGLVRKLVAVEILGSTSIAATDKTLTLTKGKMEVSKTITFSQEVPSSEENNWSQSFMKSFSRNQVLLMKILAFCNEAFVENPKDQYPIWKINGRPTDKALLKASAKVGIRKHELEEIFSKIDEIPFNSEKKYIAVLMGTKPQFEEKDLAFKKKLKASLIKDPLLDESERALFVSGAPERIMALSAMVQKDGQTVRMDQNIFKELNEKLESLTSQGLRVVAAAYKKVDAEDHSNLESQVKDLVFVGFIGLMDPLRPEAKEAIEICKKAGMRPIMATGDHLLTARAIGKELGLKTERKNIIEGRELEEMSDEYFSERVKDIDIYARVEPRHKLRIIEAWQKKGEVVAMTGDGINDAPALKKADIGVALGSGTDVAKEVSDLVLLSDNFSIIPAAVEEGRAIIDNIRKVITFLLTGSFTETILIGLSLILGLPLPIIAVQILWINLIVDGIPAVFLAFEKKEDDLMEKKPQSREIPLLTKEMKIIIFIIGIATDFLLMAIFLWFLKTLGPESIPYIRTMIFAALTLSSLFYIFSCKSLRKNIWHIDPFSNKLLLAGIAFGFSMLLLGVYFGPFQILLRTVFLSLWDWMIVIGFAFVNIVLIEAAKYYFIVRHRTDL